MPKYRAIKRGFDGVKSREIGEEFFFDKVDKEGNLLVGSWMELVEEEPEPVAPSAEKELPKGKASKAKASEKASEAPKDQAPPTGDQQVI